MKKSVFLLLISLSCSLGSNEHSLIGSRIIGFWPSWSPDGKWLSISRDDNLWLLPVDGGKEKQATSIEGKEYQATWDPSDQDGRLVFVNSKDGFFSIIVQDIEPYKLTTWYTSNNEITWPCFSRDGEKVFFLEEGKSGIRFIENPEEAPKVIQNSIGWGNKVGSLQASSVQDIIIYTILRENKYINIECIDITGGEPEVYVQREETEADYYWIHYAGESPDGNRVIYYETREMTPEERGKIYFGERAHVDFTVKLSVYEKTNGKSIVLTQSATFEAIKPAYVISYAAAYSHDGNHLAYTWMHEINYANMYEPFKEIIIID